MQMAVNLNQKYARAATLNRDSYPAVYWLDMENIRSPRDVIRPIGIIETNRRYDNVLCFVPSAIVWPLVRILSFWDDSNKESCYSFKRLFLFQWSMPTWLPKCPWLTPCNNWRFSSYCTAGSSYCTASFICIKLRPSFQLNIRIRAQ